MYNNKSILIISIFIIVFSICVLIGVCTHENKIDENVSIENQAENNSVINEEINKELEKQKSKKFYEDAIKNLDDKIFLKDVKNYKPKSNDTKITKSEAEKIAQKGFEEVAKRISKEGTDEKDSEIVQIREVSPNNCFIRHYLESDETYTNIKRKCYVFTRENYMGNGASIYVDVTTGLIIGGDVFGD